MLIGSANLTKQGLRNNFELMAEAHPHDMQQLIEKHVVNIFGKSYNAAPRVAEYINNGATRTRKKTVNKQPVQAEPDERRAGTNREISEAIQSAARRAGMTPEAFINTYRTPPTELPENDQKRRQRSRGGIGW